MSQSLRKSQLFANIRAATGHTLPPAWLIMASASHVLDPDGDVLLILRNPGASFAVWDESKEPPAVSTQIPESADGGFDLFKFADPGPPPAPQQEYYEEPAPADEGLAVADDEPVPADDQPALADDEPVPADDELVHPEDELFRPEDPPKTNLYDDHLSDSALATIEQEAPVHYRVSSRHLQLASTFFQKSFLDRWNKTIVSSSFDYTYTIDTSEWDAEAMLILQQILHGRDRSVPRFISLEMLAKIAVLVDYYECHEPVEMFADSWIQKLKEESPGGYGRDLMLWLTISWIFSREELFTEMTKTAIKESRGPLQTMNLPISERVVGKWQWDEYLDGTN